MEKSTSRCSSFQPHRLSIRCRVWRLHLLLLLSFGSIGRTKNSMGKIGTAAKRRQTCQASTCRAHLQSSGFPPHPRHPPTPRAGLDDATDVLACTPFLLSLLIILPKTHSRLSDNFLRVNTLLYICLPDCSAYRAPSLRLYVA